MTNSNITLGDALRPAPVQYWLIDIDGVGSVGSQPMDAIEDLLTNRAPRQHAERVHLSERYHIAGWVNSCGLLLPHTYPRNPVASVVLGTVGAWQAPYAGPVVFTGWNPHVGWVGRGWAEVRGMSTSQLDQMRIVTRDARIVLGKEHGKLSEFATPAWVKSVREYAHDVASVPDPAITEEGDGLDCLAAMMSRGDGRGQRTH